MVDDSGEAKPADGTPPSAPTAPAPAIVAPPAKPAAVSVEQRPAVDLPDVAPPSDLSVGVPLPPAGEDTGHRPEEGDRREAVEGGAPATVPDPTPSTEPEPDAAPLAEVAPLADVPLPAEATPATEDAPAADPTPEPPIAELVAAAAAIAEPVPAAPATTPAPVPTPRVPRTLPPILEFTAWRLLELVATVAVAAILIGLLIRGEAAVDPAILADRLGVTVPLVILALLMAALVGLPVGYLSARLGAWVDVALRALTTIGLSLNPVWLAMLLVLVLALGLQWLQPGGFIPWSNPVGALSSLLLPALALGLPLAADIASRMRDAFSAILGGPLMRTADTRGYSRAGAIRDFALRHALSQTFGRLAVPLALLVPLSLVIEAVFYLPGLGRLIFTALSERDFATLQLGLVTLVALVALCRFLGHLLQAAFDPRIARRA